MAQARVVKIRISFLYGGDLYLTVRSYDESLDIGC